jgi:hypothetical protein
MREQLVGAQIHARPVLEPEIADNGHVNGTVHRGDP